MLEDKKLRVMIHAKDSVSTVVDEYSHISFYDNTKPCGSTEIVRFYIKDLLFMNEVINHFVKPVQDRANTLSDALYPRDFGM